MWGAFKCSNFFHLVSGDANFIMEQTSLTVGGFTQPITARTLIEQPSNIEKGLSTRFLWIFPQPCYADFGSLQRINGEFADAIGMQLMHPCITIYN